MGILALVILAFAVACLTYFIIRVRKIVKEHEIGQEKPKIEGKTNKELLILVCCFAGLLAISALSGFLSRHHENVKVLEYCGVVLGPIIFGAALATGIGAFMLYYYKQELDEKQKKVCRYAWPICIVILVLGLWLYTEGVARHVYYPLVSGISFKEGWIHGSEYADGFKVKFYGICIVLGALLCYCITDHMTYKKFKKHGLIDTLFIVAFFMGILGARLWYCFVLEPSIVKSYGFIYVFVGIIDGGLAVQGGAILGIAVGVAYMLIFRKYIDVRFMMDVAVPTILLAQVCGRWGNFFNQEVYGAVTTYEKLWFVPTIVKNNMFIDGEYRIPLFFIEGVMNLGGYFIIRYLLGEVCKFHVGLGYQASAYLVWYGMVRAILELLRDAEFMYKQSWYIAFGMMGAGLLMMLGFFILHKVRMQKGLEDQFGEKI